MDTRKAAKPSAMRLGIRVDWVTRTDRVSPYHRIRAIGGLGADGLRWRRHRLELVAAQGLGKRYLKTESDGESPDRLLALGDCG
jgi:hypothetical protein